MHHKLQEWIHRREAFVGVTCLQQGDELCYAVCGLKQEKDSAKLTLQADNLRSIEALRGAVDQEQPIVLGLQVKGMLHRVLDHQPATAAAALAAVFPSAEEADFYVQQIPLEQGALITVVRRDKVEALVMPLLEAGLWVVQVFIGPFWVQEILPLLPHWTEQLQIGDQQLLVQNQHITGITKNVAEATQQFQFGEDTVPESQVLALGLAFMILTQPDLEGLAVEATQAKRENFYYKKLFHYTAIALLGVFFFALLGNYLLFERYSEQQQSLALEVAQQQSLLTQRDALAAQYRDKKALLGDQLNLGGSKASYYADQLAASLPSTLQLTRLTLFPVLETEDVYQVEETLPRYNQATILVEGRCQASVFYNNWKRGLEELDWVESIHNLQYQNDPKGQGVFQLKITIRHD